MGSLRGGVAACALLAAALACAGEAPEAPAELPGSLPGSLSTSLARSSPASLPSSFLREKPAYVDRIIAGTKPQADRATGDSDGDDALNGPPRFFSAELIASTIRANSANDNGLGSITRQRQNFSETGLVVTGEIDTASYGQLRLDGVAGLVHRAFQGSLSQRGLNFDGGWRADNVVGTLLPRRIDLGASQGRFVVPVTPLLGAASSWVRTSPDQSEPDDSGNLALNVAVGEPGTLTGIRVDGYHGLGGMSFGGGIQSALGGNWQFGVQTLVQRNVGDRYAAFATPDAPRSRLDDAAVFGILAWQADTLHVQGGIIHSSVTSRGGVEATTTSGVFGTDAAAANGIFVDASDRFGRFTVSGGGYRFDPGLSWGQDRLDDDAYGLYARGSYRSPRWQLNAGLDASRSITGLRDSETTLTAGGRYRISRDRAAGTNIVLRSAGGQNGFDVEAYGELRSRFGSTRPRADYARDPLGHTIRAGVDQDWHLPSRFGSAARLDTGISYARRVENSSTAALSPDAVASLVANPGSDVAGLALTLNAGFDFNAKVAVDASLTYDMTVDGDVICPTSGV